MKKTLILITMILMIFSTGLSIDISKRIKVFIHDEQAFRKFLATGIDMEGATGKIGGWIDIILSDVELKKILALGFQTQIITDDLTKYYSSRMVKGPVNALGFGYGSMGGNYTFDEVVQQLDSMRTLYPNLITEKFSIGNSLRGRDLWAVRITKNADVISSKPEVLYTALTHAREPQGMMNLIYFMWHLLQNYGSDAEATYLIDNRQLYFVPVINADGYEANRRISPTGGGMRRKNMRDVVSDNDYYGVDLNRNYGYMWGLDNYGSSPYPTAGTYRGAAPFSEPEILSVAFFCISHNFKTVFNYHSSGNLLLYPWDHTSLYESPDSVQFAEYGQDMTKYNHYFTGPSGQSLYLANGGATDWMYGEQGLKNKIFSFLPEVGGSSDGFWPPSERILPIAQENLYPNLYLANIAGSYPRFHSTTIDDISSDGFLEKGEAFNIQITLRNKGLDETQNLFLQLSSCTAFQISRDTFSLGTLPSQTNYELSIPCLVKMFATNNYHYIYLKIKEEPNRYSYDTIKTFVGKLNLAFSDSALYGMDNWSTNIGWGLSPLYHSPSNSFTDSPMGNYTDGSDNRLTLASSLDFHNTSKLFLRFWCRWDIEADRDFATVEASSDGGANWSTVPGHYTRSASGIGVQFTGTYGYDDIKSEWVEEEMDLSTFASSNFQIRLRMLSDDYWTSDGFYVDDIRLFALYSDTTRTISLSIDNKWNLISIPIDTPSLYKNDISPGSISSAFAYNGGIYVSFDSLKLGNGYWFKLNSSQTIEFRGKPYLTGFFDVVKGWNLIGSISDPIPVTMITSDPPGIITGNFFKYNLSYLITDIISPGSGYWVKVNQPGKLILSTNSLNNFYSRIKINPTEDLPPSAPWDEITEKILPKEFKLGEAFPNPFNPSTRIRYELAAPAIVTLKIFDLYGRLITVLVNERKDGGIYHVSWNADGMATGIYFYRMIANNPTDGKQIIFQSKKLLFIK